MNLLLLESHEITADNTVIFSDRRSEHIIRILACKPGDIVRVGVINGPVGTGEIVSIKNTEVALRFTPEGPPSEQPPLDLILGLVRPIMLKKILAQAASLGVGRIFLINANRVEKSFFGASLLKDEKYRTYLIEGLEQAKDTCLPQVSIHERFRPFIEDYIPTVESTYEKMLVAYPGGKFDMKQAVGSGTKGRTLLAVGP